MRKSKKFLIIVAGVIGYVLMMASMVFFLEILEEEPIQKTEKLDVSILEDYFYTGEELKEEFGFAAILYDKDDFVVLTRGFHEGDKFVSINGYTTPEGRPVTFCKYGKEIGQNINYRYCELFLEKTVLDKQGVVEDIIEIEIIIEVNPLNRKIISYSLQ